MLISSYKLQSLNPATLLAVWMLSILVALHLASPYGIYAAATAAIAANIFSPSQFHRLLRRSRWLLLSVALIFLFMTPGIALFSIAGVPVSSADGLRLAIDQISRLVLALALLALLLGHMDLNKLVTGLRQLLVMLRIPGFDPDRAALRLSLTLRRLEQGEQLTKSQHWQSRFDIDTGIEKAPESIALQVYPFGMIDRLVIAIALIAFIAIVVTTQIQPNGGLAL